MPLFLSNIYNKKGLLLSCIFFISIVVSLLFLIILGNIGPSQHEIPGTDYLIFYEPVANNILEGKGITLNGELGLRYPPGYPIILAIIFGLAQILSINELSLVLVFNIIIAAGAACLLFLIAESVFNKKIALIVSFLWLSYPFNLWFLKNPNTEVPFILLLYASIWLYILAVRRKKFWLFFLSGIIVGFASLVRPIAFLLPLLFVLAAFFLLKENSKKLCFLLALALLAGSLLAIFPWEAKVFLATGKILPLSTVGLPTVVDGLSFALISGAGGDQAAVSDNVLALMGRAKNGELTTGVKIIKFCFGELKRDPIAFFELIGLKLARSWYATDQMWWEGKILLVQLFYLLSGLIGIVYAFRNYKDKIRGVVFLLAIVLFFWGMTFSALSILRYMVPAMGIVIIFSAVAVDVLISKIKFFPKNKS